MSAAHQARTVLVTQPDPFPSSQGCSYTDTVWRIGCTAGFSVGEPRISEPRDGVIEAVTIVTSRARARAVAIRLEGLDRRWRASAISVL